jgi:multidrug transporter EmrE-like cation transporter
MTIRGLSFLLVSALLTVAANLMITAGVHKAGGFPVQIKLLLSAVTKLIAQPVFDCGIILYAVSSLLWFHVIATEPLSVAYPLLISLTFIFVTLGAIVIFSETLTLPKVVGILLILIGIIVLSRDKLL